MAINRIEIVNIEEPLTIEVSDKDVKTVEVMAGPQGVRGMTGTEWFIGPALPDPSTVDESDLWLISTGVNAGNVHKVVNGAWTASLANILGPITSVNGITGQNIIIGANHITTGTLPDAQLSSNVATLADVQTFTGAKTFSSAPAVPDASFTIAKTSGLQAALDLKAPLASPTFTGTVTGTFSGSGAALTSLNGTNISTGTVADARLSTNVATLTGTQTFTGIKAFTGGLSMADTTLYIRGWSDSNHAIKFAAGPSGPDGPRIYGYSGGELGYHPGTSFNAVLKWDSTGINVPVGTIKQGGISIDTLDDRVATNVRSHSSISGGGTLTVNGAYEVKWSQRFIIINNGKGTHFSTTGYFDITMPPEGTTITRAGGTGTAVTVTAGGISIPDWTALYYILPIGSSYNSVPENFRIVSYTADFEIPDHWVLIASKNPETNAIRFAHGVTLLANTTSTAANPYQQYALATNTVNLTGNQTITGAKQWGGTNPIVFTQIGAEPPTFNTRSPGTKMVWYPDVSASNVDFATGIATSTLWNSIPQATSTYSFKWYTGTTEQMKLDGTGVLTVGGQAVVKTDDSRLSDTRTPSNDADIVHKAGAETITGHKTFNAGASILGGQILGFSTQSGAAPPSFTTRSAGTKIVLWPTIAGANADYAIGIESSHMWYSADTTAAGHKWYSGTTNTMTLTGGGALTATSFSGSGASLTALNASNISSGTVADARLSTNVILLNSAQTISGIKTFSADPVFNDDAIPTAKVADLDEVLPPIASILEYAGATVPSTQWAFCNGQELAIATYGTLYNRLTANGTVFPYGANTNGSGAAGTTHFRVPNRKGKVGVGLDSADTAFDALGETGGAKTHTLTTAEMPAHTHVQDAHNHTQNSHNHTQNAHGHGATGQNDVAHTHSLNNGGNIVADGGGTGANITTGGGGYVLQSLATQSANHTHQTYNATATNIATTATNIATTATNQNTGGGGAHNILQPYITLNYIIRVI